MRLTGSRKTRINYKFLQDSHKLEVKFKSFVIAGSRNFSHKLEVFTGLA
jgi:hypothetical protein